jgi:phenylalanine-4-hydroxylase
MKMSSTKERKILRSRSIIARKDASGRIHAMTKQSSYTAKLPGPDGIYPYTAEEDAIWGELYERQMKLLANMACQDYLDGVKTLGLRPDKVPQLTDVGRRLHETTGFGVEGVPALIPPLALL